MAFMKEFHHLEIKLEDIKSATKNFDDENIIGIGGFGKVYKGSISRSTGRIMVALKRLDRRYGQGDPEFLKEIMMLSRYKHENLISLLGFCNDDGEKILVYEHALHGSLDRHLNATSLTWMQRLKICLAAARGISYLHDPSGTQQRVLHRDIKSANILLDESWNAKVSDFGLSKMGPANQQYTYLISNFVGTPGYLDPQYLEMYFLTKESDVYSFGVVLFEVLCGRLCFEYNDGRFHSLVKMWKQSYEQKKLDHIIFQDLNQQMDPRSLEIFSNIAYQCLQDTYNQRPTMTRVVEELEIALKIQEELEIALKIQEAYDLKRYEELIALQIQETYGVPLDYERLIKTAVPPLIYTSQEELKTLLSKGIILNMGKTFVSLNKNGEHCEMISAAECLEPIESLYNKYSYEYNSRFTMGSYIAFNRNFKTRIRTQFLSSNTIYTVNIVFKLINMNPKIKSPYVALKYHLLGNTQSILVSLANEREDGWLMAELYVLAIESRNVDLEIIFECSTHHFSSVLVVEGIEFRPMEKVEDEVLEDEKVDMQPNLDLDTFWEQKLPTDYEEILKLLKYEVKWITKKELYFVLCEGFPINNGQEWFYLSKDGKKCGMLPARTTLQNDKLRWLSIPATRFGEAAVLNDEGFVIVSEIKSQLLSPQTRYACYLVYKLPENHFVSEVPITVMDKTLSSFVWDLTDFWFIHLLSPQTPVIRGKHDTNNRKRNRGLNMKGLPQARKDGWMEVKIWEFQTGFVTLTHFMRLELNMSLKGLIVQGIEFKPL
ncbi:hypothetical protein R6Q59_007418 [Mikania micrantha]